MNALALAFVIAVSGLAQSTQPDRGGEPPVPTLTVRGEAILYRPADQLRLSIGVVTESVDATEALRANSRRMQDCVKALTKVGLTKQECKTGRFSIQPQYARRPRDANADWTPRIIGYRVTNTLSIRTRQIDLAGEIIQAANEAGANSIDSIGFDLANPRTHRAEAIASATENARSDAGVLAEASEVRLVRILSINLDQAGWRPPVPMMQAGRAVAMAEAVAPPPIEPGEVTVEASVTIVYEIAPRS